MLTDGHTRDTPFIQDMSSFLLFTIFAGISSWGRKVGRRLELLTIADNETLTYNVNPGYSRPSQFSRSVASVLMEDQASSLGNHHEDKYWLLFILAGSKL